MKRIKRTTIILSSLILMFFFSACDLYTYVTPSAQITYDNPSWAPPYYPGVRYYYLPDIETFYDLNQQEFVYLDNGQWTYSQSLPSIYAGYDLSDCFTVAIDFNTYQPWLHYQYYVSHYPRYYYRDYYDHSNIPYVRGFNENSKSAIYWSENERHRARRWDNENSKNDHKFKYSESDRRQQNNINLNNGNPRKEDLDIETRRQPDNRISRPQQPNRDNNNTIRQQPNSRENNSSTIVNPENGNTNRPQGNDKNSIVPLPRISGFETGSRQQNAVTPVRPNQNTNYYGRTIGRPVKVEKQMREPVPAKNSTTNETRNRNDSKDQNDNNRR